MLKAHYLKYVLDFKFDAGTSRGVLKEKDTYFIRVTDSEKHGIAGVGECGPLKGLSVDDVPELEEELNRVISELESFACPKERKDLNELLTHLVRPEFPSVRFGLETALLDLMNGGEFRIFDNPFSRGKKEIPINGLVWMGDEEFMHRQIEDKINEGYTCIKMKIGAIDFDTEYELLKGIRDRFNAQQMTLRVDANGAFHPDEALEKLDKLSHLAIHSIEQPIRQGQLQAMRKLCAETPLPIALDEELIGIHDYELKNTLLDQIKPQYIILKPTLLGGLQATEEWIELAQKKDIGWWITSALESNVGLNAISQFTANFDTGEFPQGLGTGKLYKNNVASPLTIRNGYLHYDTDKNWDISRLNLDDF